MGDDAAATELGRELKTCGADTAGLLTCHDRPTTLKTRILGYVQSAGRALQQIVRMDEERTVPISPEQSEQILRIALDMMQQADLVLIQDMAKGLFSRDLLQAIITEAAGRSKPVIADPERGEDYSGYRGASCLLPNRFEAETVTGISLDGEEAYRQAAGKLIEELALDAAVIKLDREGIFYATAGGEGKHITTRARDVSDVTGAGDMVAAVVALVTAAGGPLEQAVELANIAAGIEVARYGAAPISRSELLEELTAQADPVLRKVKSRDELPETLSLRRQRGEKVVFTNGCFDLLHLGHVELVRFARRQGDCLIVGLNSDRSARELKGPGRPINNQEVRARILCSLADVDYVVLFDEASVEPLIREVRPDVLVKGGDYDKTGVVGHEFVESYGGQVRLAPEVKGLSTTELMRRIAGNNEPRDREDPQADG